MVKCERCGVETYMPFRCNYCGGYFCERHRLPEFHECPGVYNVSKSTFSTGRTTRDEYQSAPRQRAASFASFRFSNRELRDLAIALAIIVAFPLILLGRRLLRSPLVALGAVGIFAAAFLIHELAHKFTAQRYGYWAEFRINQLGLLITLLSFLSPLMVFAPGAVMIAGLLYGDDYGKIAISGPVTNIAQALLYMLAYNTGSSPVVGTLAYLGMYINSSLALFNLIPFGAFDGLKVLRWDWRAWLAAVVSAGLVFIYSVF